MIKFLAPLLCCALGLVSTASADKADWLREARFGMFIHWGVYAVPAGEWQGKRVTGGPGEWIMKCGSIPIADYKKFANDFTASKYDPEAWVRLAKKAGMKYIVITSKHHDGFALYDSKVADWNAPDLRVKYHVRTPSAGKWKVSADVASQKSVTLGIRVGKDKDSTPAKISATSKEPAWHTVDLGTIDLSEGESTIELVPDKTAWGKFRLRTVRLTQVK